MTDLTDHLTAAMNLALSLLEPDHGEGRRYKTDRDFATAADDRIEDEVRALLATLTPQIGFLGEERGHSGSTETFWCLDPIDGTVNYARAVPMFGVSLALIDQGRPTHAQIVLPQLQQRFAVDLEQATCNGEPVHVSACTKLGDAMVSVGDFATGVNSQTKNVARLRTVSLLADRAQRVRMFGSAATDLVWLAAGHTDAVIMHGGHPWDVAAGVAIARAAGATITHIDGSAYDVAGVGLLAAAPGIHRELVELLAAESATGLANKSPI